MTLSAPLPRLKRNARLLAREAGIPLHQALDRIAADEGFQRWSHLSAAAPGQSFAGRILDRLTPGSLALLAARPRQGKTLLGFEVAVSAASGGGHGAFFTLEHTSRDLPTFREAIGLDTLPAPGRFRFEDTDELCVPWLVDALADAAHGTVVTVDYLQLLDQRRSTPDLASQLLDLSAFALERGLAFLLLSQVHRQFDGAGRDCPDVDDLRLPNPVDLSLFDCAWFLHGGTLRGQRLT